MNKEDLFANAARWMTTAGVTVFLALICSTVLLVNSACDTPERGGWFAARAASCWLALFWVIMAMVLLSVHPYKPSRLLQIVFAMNGTAVLLLLASSIFT